MRIALAQINPILGNFLENSRAVLSHIKKAKSLGADLVVFPELTLMGYPPMDLLERERVALDQLKVFTSLESKLPEGIAALVGVITLNAKQGKPYFNSAAFLEKGKKTRFFHKSLLPAYDVFDEARHFHFGSVEDNVFRWRGKRLLVTICEDIWAWKKEERLHHINPLKNISPDKVDLILNLSASPFSLGKDDLRLEMAQKTSRYFRSPMVYVNAVGAQDEIIFDGGSFVLGPSGEKDLQMSSFVEDLKIWDMAQGSPAKKIKTEIHDSAHLRKALVLGIGDFCRKNRIDRVHLGLSGGIDSAVVACLAAEALGPKNVHAIAMPGPHSSAVSLEFARALAKDLGCGFDALDIEPSYFVAQKTLEKTWGHSSFGVVQENLQARLRALYLMAYSNKTGSMLLNTSNKSELATGYSTLYGDLAGGLSPIGDLLKHQVYGVALSYQEQGRGSLEKIIAREPSAELRPNQRDKDTLPPYPDLDRAVERIVEERRPIKSKTEKWLEPVLKASEFKRWQAPPILRVSDHAFGRGRRWPIAHQLLRL